mgnify:CR=1 FL=1
MAVYLNQKKPEEWITEQLKQENVIPSLSAIETNGILANDSRTPTGNPWYQYCAYATETLGVKALMPVLSKRFKVQTVFIDNKAI